MATLAGIAAAGRILFAPIPSVQPVTVIVAAAGVALGPRRGFAVGALAAIASNMFLGQGPHTPWQMLAWGGCGALAGVFRLALHRRWPFAFFCAVLGMAFGTLMDLWLWFAFYPHTWAALVTVLAAGIAFNIAHALGNFVLALAAGPELRRVLDRHARTRAHGGGVGVRWVLVLARVCGAGRRGSRSDRSRCGFGGVPREPPERERRLRRAGAGTGCRADGLGGAWPRRGERLRGGACAGARVPPARAPTDGATDGDVALRVVALAALGEPVDESLVARLRRAPARTRS